MTNAPEIILHNSDCMDVFRTIGNESVDLVLTDCPYKIVSGGCTNTIQSWTHGDDESVKSGKLFRNNMIEFSEWLPEVYRILKNESHAYIMINARNLNNLWTEAEKAGFIYQQLLVWDKGNLTPNRYYMNGYELILMLRKGKAKTINKPGQSNIIRVPSIVGMKTHPTQKPIQLMRLLIENSTEPGQIVIDPFMGTGAAGVASRITGRGFIGIEIDTAFYKIAVNRITAECFPGEAMK